VDGETVRYEETVQVITTGQNDPAAYLTGVVTVSTPVASDNSVTVYQSDHYDDDESRSLEWSTTSADTWPTLTSASIAFVAEHARESSTITVAGSVIAAAVHERKHAVRGAASARSERYFSRGQRGHWHGIDQAGAR